MQSTSFANQTLQCCQCHRPFTYTTQQQEEHQRKGYKHKPKRCASCRTKRKRNVGGNGKMSHEETTIELCKAVTELRIFIEKESKRLHQRLDGIETALDEALYEEDDHGP